MKNNIKYLFDGKPIGLFGELGKHGKGALLFGGGAGLFLGAKRVHDLNKDIPENNPFRLPFSFEYKKVRRR